jgi:hypothetical protein
VNPVNPEQTVVEADEALVAAYFELPDEELDVGRMSAWLLRVELDRCGLLLGVVNGAACVRCVRPIGVVCCLRCSLSAIKCSAWTRTEVIRIHHATSRNDVVRRAVPPTPRYQRVSSHAIRISYTGT